MYGDGLFTLFGEKPLCLKFLFQGLQCALQRTITRRLHVIDNQLIVAASLVDGKQASNDNGVPYLRLKPHAHVCASEHRTTKLSSVVFEAEIPVS